MGIIFQYTIYYVVFFIYFKKLAIRPSSEINDSCVCMYVFRKLENKLLAILGHVMT